MHLLARKTFMASSISAIEIEACPAPAENIYVFEILSVVIIFRIVFFVFVNAFFGGVNYQKFMGNLPTSKLGR